MEPYEKYDYREIKQKGTELQAAITLIHSVDNLSYNGQHPIVLSYRYDNNGTVAEDKFETLGSEKITALGLDSSKTATVFVYKNQSVVKDLDQFSFPIDTFYILPGIFLLIGIPFLLIGLIPALRVYNLYKTGLVKDAYLISMESITGGLLATRFRQSIEVNYYYLNQVKDKIFEKSNTTDLLILNDKKEGDVIKIFISKTDEHNTCIVPRLEAMKYKWSI
ncbi:hypothetical protein A0256_10320 [Mucilaginibacter sp. PAMC 26640]|nr:hypothetical protein A0256_10320 [Mucilaginibacter sp. PAMC 26640]